LIALRQEDQPHELQHRSDQMDNDPSERTAKTNSTPPYCRAAVKLSWSNGEERKKQHFAYAFELGRGQAARLREVDDGERNLAHYGYPAAPAPNSFGRRFYCQQEIAMTNRRGENGVASNKRRRNLSRLDH